MDALKVEKTVDNIGNDKNSYRKLLVGELQNTTHLTLKCGFVSLEASEFPRNLTYLKLDTCETLISLKTIPEKLTELHVTKCWIRSLPTLPNNLEVLHLNECDRLKELPKLPNNLKELCITNCNELNFNQDLIESLSRLEENGCIVKCPPHFDSKPNEEVAGREGGFEIKTVQEGTKMKTWL